MEEILISIGRKGLPFTAAVSVFGLLLSLFPEEGLPQRVLHTFCELSGFLKRRRHAVAWYGRKTEWLTRHGAAFHYGRKIEPVGYLAAKLILGVLGMAVVVPVSAVGGAALGIFLYALPDILLLYLDKKDNEQLLPELRLVYHALEVQLRAGIYLTDALTECYGSVETARLRGALLDLAGEIVLKADVHEALERFQGKFDNRYIDSLCLILFQALESGQAIELLRDIGEQLKDMEQTVLEKRKSALDRRVTFYQLIILASVLTIALYACIVHMMSAALF